MAASSSQENLVAVLTHYGESGDSDAVYQSQCETWFQNFSPTDRLVVASVLEALDYGREEEAEALASYLPPAPKQ